MSRERYGALQNENDNNQMASMQEVSSNDEFEIIDSSVSTQLEEEPPYFNENS